MKTAARSYKEANPGAAVLALCRAVELEPRNPSTMRQLGVALLALGHAADAARMIEYSLRLDPTAAETWCELGNAYHLASRLEEAAAAYGQAVRIDPGHSRAQYNLGVTRMMENRTGEALACFAAAVEADPSYVDAHNNRGILQQLCGQLDASIESYRQALVHQPDDMRAAYNLGVALQSAGRLEEAEQVYRRLLRAGETNSSAHNNLGNVLLALGRVPEAIGHYRRARFHEPANAEARLNLGLAHLLVGDYERGWEGYEYRRVQPGAVSRRFAKPRWMGEPLEGRRILLHAEQGLGDTIQFVRFAPVLAGRGAAVILQCQPEAAPLMETMPGITAAVGYRAAEAGGESLPEFDYHSPLLSVPGVLRTSLKTIPAGVPYLFPRRPAVERWAAMLAGLVPAGAKRRVGVAWAGNPRHPNDANRSIPLARLAPLFDLAGVFFASLQKGEAAAQIAAAGSRVYDFGPLLTDLEQTAAAILQLDLVISVDTMVAHLAGALGRPVWLLAPFAPDWRWMLERSDSPWYPTMRLFRQHRRGGWDSVIDEVRQALTESAFAIQA